MSKELITDAFVIEKLQKQRLERQAKLDERSKSWHVRQALTMYFAWLDQPKDDHGQMAVARP
jgi:predicted transcriptional regulator